MYICACTVYCLLFTITLDNQPRVRINGEFEYINLCAIILVAIWYYNNVTDTHMHVQMCQISRSLCYNYNRSDAY